MNLLAAKLRKRLERAIADAREVAEAGARAALQTLAVHVREPYGHMSTRERTLRRRLRAHGRQLGDRRDARSGTQSIDRLVIECAYEHWHGMLFARFLAENNLLIAAEWNDVPVSLKDCEDLGKEEGLDKWAMAARFAHRMLPQVFRPAHPAFEVRFAREYRQKLEALIESLPVNIFVAVDALGWVYQFWQSKKKDEVNRSEVKIGADELPAVTQLFTEPYMVAFLLDNTLGAWWAARRLNDDDLSGAVSEMELRRKAAIRGAPLDYLRFVRTPIASPDIGGDARKTDDQNVSTHFPASTPAPPAPSTQVLPSSSARVLPSPSAQVLPSLSAQVLPSSSGQVLPSPSGRGAGGEGKKTTIPADILKYARTLRHEQTDAEQLLWGLLRDRRFAGRKFRRQHPVGRYILDFYCHESRLAVELDGGQHNDGETRSHDDRRSRFLREQGIRVVRFWNHDVLQQTDSVLESLWDEVHFDSVASAPSPQTPLPEGEGFTSPEAGGAALASLHASTVASRPGAVASRRSSDPDGEEAVAANLPGRGKIMSAEGQSRWTPAAGRFVGWPDDLARFRLLDPCCGSGHFLVAAFSMLVPMRMELEGLSARDAVDVVLRENLHGLELDPRCVEVAAFALALAAWTYPDAGGYRLLPEMNLACSGLAPNATKEQWTALSEQAAAAGELPLGRDLFGVDDAPLSAPSAPLRNSMETLYGLFEQAPVLGSLIDPNALESDLFQRDFESIRGLFAVVLEQERKNDDQIERAVAARGMARAAQLLSDRYTLVVTNVPYLARGKQGDVLRAFSERHYPLAKNDLATVFLERCLRLCTEGGTASLVLPQNWLFLTSYRKLRQRLLKTETWHMLARLGPGAFDTVTGEVVKAILLTLCPTHSFGFSDDQGDGNLPAGAISGLDVSESGAVIEKAKRLREGSIQCSGQAQQLINPDARIVLVNRPLLPLVHEVADALVGLQTSDDSMFVTAFWEHAIVDHSVWEYLQSTPENYSLVDGQSWLVRWEQGKGALFSLHTAWPTKGLKAIGKSGIAIYRTQKIFSYFFGKERFHQNVAVIVPRSDHHLPALWCFCSSPEYGEEVRHIDQKLNVTNATLAKVPFDLDYWARTADEQYPNGLPCPYTDDPTQWIFHGHPCGSVVWDKTQKQTTHGPLRTEPAVLQVAVARLLGYRWPAEHDIEMELSVEQREWVRRTETLLEWMDEDGIVCIPSVRGEPPARDRLLGLLAAAFGESWSDGVLARLLADADSNSLDDWLRDRFFEEHCKLFHHRPFIWHIWDGRRRDGFHALVNYHKLAAAGGKGRQLLESLTYSYLGDWIARQRDGVQRDEEGADDRLAAALALKGRLEAILKGEPPFDIFVRWKPIHEQPIGWEPDLDDGVRINIRPFMAADIYGGKKGAGVLRTKPRIHWKKDRGKEVLKPAKRSKSSWLQGEEDVTDPGKDHELRPRQDYPWFWTCPGDGPSASRTDFPGGTHFDGNRWNDLHYTNAMKSAARERKHQWEAMWSHTHERTTDVRMAAARGQSGRERPDP